MPKWSMPPETENVSEEDLEEIKEKLLGQLSTMGAEANNQGHDIGENYFGDDTIGLQYSCLFENSCDFCAALDGMTIDVTTPEGQELEEKYSPQQHDNCNCVWVGILEGEKFVNDNKDFEEKVKEEFVKRDPSYKNKPYEDILIDFARQNITHRPDIWEETFGKDFIEQMTDENIAKSTEAALKSFAKRFGDVVDFEDDEGEIFKFVNGKVIRINDLESEGE